MAFMIISHPDGRTYSVEEEAFHRLYEPEGFTIDHPEAPEDFIATGIPAPKRPRTRPASKRSARNAAPETPAEPQPEPEA